MHGYGVYKFPDGRVYCGEWNNNIRTGFGKLVYPNGTYYEG